MEPRPERSYEYFARLKTPADEATLASSHRSKPTFLEVMEDAGIEVLDDATPEDDEADEPAPFFDEALTPHPHRRRIEARVCLREERASAVQDMLAFIYPHLECSVSWANVSDLLLLSRKFDMPLLRRHCIVFLLNSAAGKPIQAMKLAEEHIITDVYKEASRFLLDKFVLPLGQSKPLLTCGATATRTGTKSNWPS